MLDQGNSGFYSGAVDGVFGEVTDGAVKEYQTRFKLTIDGIVGLKTKAAMMRPENDGLAHIGLESGGYGTFFPTLFFFLLFPPVLHFARTYPNFQD